MVTVIIDSADNGLIKTIKDDNINGAGAKFESKTVYDFKDDLHHNKKIDFFYSLAEDLGINVGNIHKNNNLIMNVDWGQSYKPTKDEINLKIKELNLKIQSLENLIK